MCVADEYLFIQRASVALSFDGPTSDWESAPSDNIVFNFGTNCSFMLVMEMPNGKRNIS